MKDTLFDSIKFIPAGGFEFDQRVVDVFDDMVSRSVPGYGTIQLLVADLAIQFAKNDCIYDLGCSTGTTIKAIYDRCIHKNIRQPMCIGLDTSPEMIQKAKIKLESYKQAKFYTIDFTLEPFLTDQPASVIILSLALQFVRPIKRQQIVDSLYEKLKPGGALILIEKTVEQDKVMQGLFVDYYHQFKAEMGYSQMEISNKREALENVLIPYQKEENLQMLIKAGFESVSTFFQWFNFAGFLAIK